MDRDSDKWFRIGIGLGLETAVVIAACVGDSRSVAAIKQQIVRLKARCDEMDAAGEGKSDG